LVNEKRRLCVRGQARRHGVDTFGPCRGSRESQLDDGYFHVTARGSTGTAIFVDDLDRLDFLDLLRTTADLCGWRLHAHCLMGTHYHLLVESLRVSLSTECSD
jgi:REP element-mobilizing transposase RayT